MTGRRFPASLRELSANAIRQGGKLRQKVARSSGPAAAADGPVAVLPEPRGDGTSRGPRDVNEPGFYGETKRFAPDSKQLFTIGPIRPDSLTWLNGCVRLVSLHKGFGSLCTKYGIA